MTFFQCQISKFNIYFFFVKPLGCFFFLMWGLIYFLKSALTSHYLNFIKLNLNEGVGLISFILSADVLV